MQRLLEGAFHAHYSPPQGGSPGFAVGVFSAPAALPALLRATHLFGLALGSALGRLRESGMTVAKLFERAEELAMLLRMMREGAGILGARWDKVPERHRPHYAAEQRFRILRIRSFLGLSQRETAELFRVSTETIARWEMEATSDDGKRVRPLVSDREGCFAGRVFRQTLRRLDVRPRFGAIGEKGSIALIERPWRTLKFRGGRWSESSCAC